MRLLDILYEIAANQPDATDDENPKDNQAATPQPAEPEQQPAKPEQAPDQPTNTPATAIATQPLSVTMDILADAMPYLDQEIIKINKTALKVGAPEVEANVDKQYYKDIKWENEDGTTGTHKVKMFTVTVIGSTPRIQAADGTTWNFIGVITPSQAGKAILKLVPDAEDTQTLRALYNANPYYCDYCKKIRNRNETFIVQNGQNYRQVGRNCLKDFVGGANPQALLNFFSWFSTPEHLEARLNQKGEERSGERGGGRGTYYLAPLEILEATVAVVQYRGGYVSSKAEEGRSTGTDVRLILWGKPAYMDRREKEDYNAMLKILRSDEKVPQNAKKILDWFKALPAETVEGNTFFKNIKIMVDEDAVDSKMIGYIVGLYPAHQKSLQREQEKKGPALVKEWPTDWGQGPKAVKEERATVKFVRSFAGQYGVTLFINMMLDSGQGITWKYSGSQPVEIGDEYTVTGTFEPDTYFTPPHVKFVADRKWLRSTFPAQVKANEEKQAAADAEKK